MRVTIGLAVVDERSYDDSDEVFVTAGQFVSIQIESFTVGTASACVPRVNGLARSVKTTMGYIGDPFRWIVKLTHLSNSQKQTYL